MGQILLARRMGKPRIIAETGAGQHGVATATACARFGLKCVVYMGAVDVERQKPNVFRMKMLGAEVVPVQSGARTLKDAMNEALRDWVTNVADTFYCIGTAAGPHPYPAMVRDFQSVIGTETREQMQQAEGRLPDSLVACIGGGSNAIGLFHPFLDDESVEIFGVEAAGHGLDVPDGHAASLAGGRPGVLHGNRTYLLMNEDGQINEGHSISAGLDYPGIGPEHAWLKESGRVTYLSATDKEALEAFQLCSKLEGIIPALEPAHALAKVMELAPDNAARPPDGDEPVRARRQGHLLGRRASRRDVTYEEFDRFCGSLPAATFVVQWGGAHVWKVGGKVFAVGGWEEGGPAFTFKATPLAFEMMKAAPGLRPAPYLGSRGAWLQRIDAASLSDQDLCSYLRQSHALVAAGLTRAARRALGL